MNRLSKIDEKMKELRGDKTESGEINTDRWGDRERAIGRLREMR